MTPKELWARYEAQEHSNIIGDTKTRYKHRCTNPRCPNYEGVWHSPGRTDRPSCDDCVLDILKRYMGGKGIV